MPEQDPHDKPEPNALEQAEQAERASGKEEGDRVEGEAQAKAEEAERNSGAGPSGG